VIGNEIAIAVGNQESDPSAVVYTVGYATAEIQTPLSAQR